MFPGKSSHVSLKRPIMVGIEVAGDDSPEQSAAGQSLRAALAQEEEHPHDIRLPHEDGQCTELLWMC